MSGTCAWMREMHAQKRFWCRCSQTKREAGDSIEPVWNRQDCISGAVKPVGGFRAGCSMTLPGFRGTALAKSKVSPVPMYHVPCSTVTYRALGCQMQRREDFQFSCVTCAEKFLQFFHEGIELIVMHPMSGVGESDDPCVAKMTRPSVFLRIGSPALLTIAKQRWTADGMPQFLQFRLCNIHGREHVYIIVEFPAPSTVLIAAGSVQCEMLRLVCGEVLVLAAHPLQRVGQRGVAARAARAHGPPVADPFLPALRQRPLLPLCEHLRRWSKSLDGNDATHLVRIQAGIAQRDVAAQRVSDDGNRCEFDLMSDLRQVVDIGCHRVITVRGPGAVAVAAQIRGHDMPVGAQAVGHPIPAAAMVPSAVSQQQWRCRRIPPVDVVQLQALRNITMRGGAGTDHIGRSLFRSRSSIPIWTY